MTEIESTFRERLEMDLDFGYDFTKSSDVEVLTLGFDLAYRAEVSISSLRFDTKRTDRGENGGLVDQASLDLDYTRLLDNRSWKISLRRRDQRPRLYRNNQV